MMKKLLSYWLILPMFLGLSMQAQITAPFTESFDSTSVPSTWSNYNDCSSTSANGSWKVGGTLGYDASSCSDHTGNGGQFIWVDGSTPYPCKVSIETDSIDISNLNSLFLEFYLYSYNVSNASAGFNTFSVDLYDGAQWNDSVYVSKSSNPTADWKYVAADLSSYTTSGKIVLRFNVDKDAATPFYNDIAIDDISVSNVPLCPKPTAPVYANITSSSADLSWTSGGTSFVLEYGPCGFTQGTGQLDTVATNSTTITGLSGNTEYEVYILNDCSGAGNGVSSWVSAGCFKTNCNAIAVPIFEGFEGAAGGSTTNPSEPDCWNFVESSGAPGYGYTYASATYAHTGTNSFRFYSSSNPTSGDTQAIASPAIQNIATTGVAVEFWARSFYAGGSYNCRVAVGTMSDPDDISTLTILDTFEIGSNTTYQYFVYYVTTANGYNGTDEYVAIVDASDATDYLTVDDIEITVAPSCIPSTGLQSSNITPTTAQLDWLAGDGLNYQIEYGPTGFTQGTGPVIKGILDTNYTLTGLGDNTCYDVYLRDSCANGFSPWFGPITFCTTCLPATMPYSEDFSGWEPSCFSFSNTNGWDWIHHSNGHAEASFWSNSAGSATMKAPLVTISQKAQVKFSWAHLYSASYPDDRMIVRSRPVGGQWDTLMDISGPTFTSPNAANTSPPAQADFVNEIFYLDSATYVGNDAEFEFIGVTDWGPDLFVDDFMVEAVPNCPDPTQLAASMIQGYQATIDWSFAGGNQFVIEYGPQGFVPATGGGIKDTVTGPPYTITGLTPTNCYDVYVLALCSPSGTSQWVGPLTFCTAVSCPAPTNINATSLTTTSATIDWTTGGAANYDYVWGALGTTPATGTLVTGGTTIPLTLNGLTAATTYTIWVRDSCGVGDVSTWAGPYNFTTLCNPFSLNYLETWSSWTPPAAPPCWDDQGGSQTVVKNGNTAGFNFWSWPSPNDAYLTSPAITISQKARLKVKWSSNGSTFYNDTVYVLAKEVSATSWDTVDVWGNPDCQCGATNTAPSSTPVDSIYALDSNYVGSDIQVRFWGKSGYGPDVFIHEVAVEVDPNFATCPAPQGLSASNITSTSADLGWTSTGTNFQISYGTGSFMANAGTKVVTTNNPYSLTGLTSNTNYGYYVRNICGPGDTSVWGGPFSFTTLCSVFSMPYTENWASWAPPAPIPCWDDQGGTQTVIKNLNTAEFNFWGWTTGNDAYLTSPAVNVSAPAQLRVRWSSTGSTVYNDTVWILAKPISATNWDTVDTWALPDCQCGATNTSPSATPIDSIYPLDPAYMGSDIQVRIYGRSGYGPDVFIHEVAVEGLSSCPAPTGLTTTNVGCTEVTLDWTSDAGTVQTGLIWDTTGFDPTMGGNLVPSITSPYTVSGLMPGGVYDFYIIDSCATGVSGPVMITDTTATGPLPTISFTAMQTDTTATTAEWTFDASASSDYTTVSWDFGDGNSGSNAMEVHDYNMNQSYNVTLTLTNDCGSVDTTFAVNVQGISIEETMLSRTLNVFPNPSSGQVNVVLTTDGIQNVKVNVVNMIGSRIYTKDLGRVTGEQTVQLDLSNNASGVYMIQIVTEHGTIAKRLTLSTK